jgi:hypothetical protein
MDPMFYILALAIGAGGMKMLFKRLHIPFAEIYFKRGPIAWIKFPDRQKVPFDISKQKNGYFVLYNNKIKGIFRINPKYVYFMGKTPCYDYSTKDMNPIDEELVDELWKYLHRNKLTKLKRKDVRHSKILRSFDLRLGKGIAKTQLAKRTDKEGMAMEAIVDEAKVAMQNQLEEINKQQERPIELGKTDEAFFILKFLKSKGVINDEEHATFIHKIENEIIDFGGLIQELRDMSVVSINEPLNEDVEAFVEDFGSQDPLNMSGHVDDLRSAKKGLHSMTPVPVKSFIPAGIILAGGLLAIFVVVLLSNGTIKLDGIGGGLGGFKLPGMP